MLNDTCLIAAVSSGFLEIVICNIISKASGWCVWLPRCRVFYFELSGRWHLWREPGCLVLKVFNGNGVLIGWTGTFRLIQVLCWLLEKSETSLEQRGKTGCDDLLQPSSHRRSAPFWEYGA